VTPPITILFAVSALLLTAGLVVLWFARYRRRETGVPRGRVVYDDTGAWQECPSPLFSQRYLLAGKPDYIVARGDHFIPVEVKPRCIAGRPFLSDVLQLAAYCLLIEENFEQAPPYAILKYATQTFPVENTPQLRRQLLTTMESMRRDLTNAEVAPSHHSPRRCRACGYREHCGESL
jgi:CRISPR-associated exonuclease Cas4